MTKALLEVPIYRNKTASIDLRLLICISVCAVAIFDAFTMWNLELWGKLVAYGFKAICFVSIFYLIRENTKPNYWLALAVFPFARMFWEANPLVGLQYFFSGVAPVICFALLSDEEKMTVVRFFLRFFAIIYIPGIIIFVTAIYLGVDLPHSDVTHALDGRAYASYFKIMYLSYGARVRFASIFDEPGVVGTLSAIIALYYGTFLKRWERIIFFIAGILSLSLFYMGLFVPLLLLSRFRYQSIAKQLKSLVVIFFAAAFIYLSLSFIIDSFFQEDEILRVFIHQRFKWNNGFIVGVAANRDVDIGGFTTGFNYLINNPDTKLFLGHGRMSIVEDFGQGGLSDKVFVYRYGLIMYVYIMIFYCCLHDWRKSIIFNLTSILFLYVLFSQRPMLFKIDFFIVLFVGICMPKMQTYCQISKYE